MYEDFGVLKFGGVYMSDSRTRRAINRARWVMFKGVGYYGRFAPKYDCIKVQDRCHGCHYYSAIDNKFDHQQLCKECAHFEPLSTDGVMCESI